MARRNDVKSKSIVYDGPMKVDLRSLAPSSAGGSHLAGSKYELGHAAAGQAVGGPG